MVHPAAPNSKNMFTSSFQSIAASATLRASLRIERAARLAAIVHRAGEPIGDKRAHNQNTGEHSDAQ